MPRTEEPNAVTAEVIGICCDCGGDAVVEISTGIAPGVWSDSKKLCDECAYKSLRELP